MGKSSLRKVKPVTLEDLISLFNEKKISAEELAEKAIPLLIAREAYEVFCLFVNLAGNYPEHYNVRSIRETNLFRDAVVAYEAKIAAEMAVHAPALVQAEETARRVEATFNQAEDQSASV